MTATPTTLLVSETHVIDSRQNGRTYQITVSLPLGYSKSPDEGWPFNDLPERFPVVYVLDGNWYAAMIAGMIRPMAWCGTTTDAIVVGIGYPEGDDPVNAFQITYTRRDLDLTPVEDEKTRQIMETNRKCAVPNGDAAGFLRFIQTELIPFIEGTYRADPAWRILVGHSYGGLFALYSLFEAPDLFQKLVIGSPTLAYAKPFTFEQESAFAQGHNDLAASVYLFVGELEESLDDCTMTDTLRMAAILQGRHYAGLSLMKQVFADQGHCEVAAPGFQWGLKHALKK